MSKRMKYDFERLDTYCKENNVTLLEDYSGLSLTKISIIKGNCVYDDCKDFFEKKFEYLIRTGAYCKNCIKLMSIQRAKQTFLEKYGSENILKLDFVKEKTNPNKFTFEKLQDYCKEKNIELRDDYSKCHLTKQNKITAKCQSSECNEIVCKIFREIEKRGIFCKECSNKIKIEKTKITSLQKYGVDNPSKSNEVREKLKKTYLNKYGVMHTFQSENIKSKIKDTILKRYGVENPTQNSEIMNKIRSTNLAKYGCETTLYSECIKSKVRESIKNKYGVENISQNQDIKNKKITTCLKNWGVKYPVQNKTIQEKIKKTNLLYLGVEYPTQNENVKNKIKKTCLEKYGVNYSWQNEDVKNKIKATNLIKFGVEYPTQNEEVKNKIKNVNNEKYGVDYPAQNNYVKLKTKKTNLQKYGVEYPIQNPEIMEKQVKLSYNKKFYLFPSGRIEMVQGYEPFALDDLILNEKINELDIIVGVKNVPEIWYIDENNIEHRYYVDIYIPSQNKCIEVKSLYTYIKDEYINLLKKDAVLKLGYDFEFWIYDNKGNRVNYV